MKTIEQLFEIAGIKDIDKAMSILNEIGPSPELVKSARETTDYLNKHYKKQMLDVIEDLEERGNTTDLEKIIEKIIFDYQKNNPTQKFAYEVKHTEWGNFIITFASRNVTKENPFTLDRALIDGFCTFFGQFRDKKGLGIRIDNWNLSDSSHASSVHIVIGT